MRLTTRRLLTVAVGLLVVSIAGPSISASAAEPVWREAPELREVFERAGVDGTFVLFDLEAETFVGWNEARARTRYLPASTFKVANTLIGLTTGTVESVDEVLPYGGRPQRLEIWEQDMPLRDAIRVSNVPVYQELARRIGPERMRAELERLGYGNAEIGERVDMFWLVGPLEISAVEQVRFLADLALGNLPASEEAQAATREILEIESGAHDDGASWTLFAKTGWANAPDPDVGWWVGWVELSSAPEGSDDAVGEGPTRILPFAVNLDMPENGDAKKRTEIGKACLRILGVL